jgi:hypothetical protein
MQHGQIPHFNSVCSCLKLFSRALSRFRNFSGQQREVFIDEMMEGGMLAGTPDKELFNW